MIKKGKVVSLCYMLKNDKGEELDRADKAEPFTYLHGASQIVPGLESAIEKLKPGDKKKVTVSAEEGYGEIDPNLRLSIERSVFPTDMPLKPGVQFEASLGEEGGEAVFTIQSVEGDKVHVDGNHPLAGQTLHFEIEVLAVRDATKEELSHGHVHGADGEHHHNH
jgi:FKBP-type peptidyl-prolyl cis-trans isomerase SlyD